MELMDAVMLVLSKGRSRTWATIIGIEELV